MSWCFGFLGIAWRGEAVALTRPVWWIFGAVLAAVIAASAVGLVPAAGGGPATCTAAQKAARLKALKAFKAGMAARRKVFFRKHKHKAARQRFVRAQRARLRRLEAAARCVVLPPAAQVVATVPLAGANRFTVAAGSLWVSSYAGSGSVARIDPSTNQVLTRIAVGAGGDIGFGFGSIWEVDGTDSTISRIDPATNHVAATFPTRGSGANGLAFSSSNVWVANHNEPATTNGANAAKIDPATNQVVATIPIGDANGGPAWLIGAAGSIWTFDQTQRRIVRIDPTTDTTTYISSPDGMSANRHFTTDGTRTWFSVPADPGRNQPAEVQAIDPATNTISTVLGSATLAGYGLSDVYGLLYDSGSLWLSGPCGAQACILRLAANGDAITGAWSFPGSGSQDSLQLAITAGSLWVSEHQGVLRLNPG